MSRVEECDEETLLVWPLCVLYTDPDPPAQQQPGNRHGEEQDSPSPDMDE